MMTHYEGPLGMSVVLWLVLCVVGCVLTVALALAAMRQD